MFKERVVYFAVIKKALQTQRNAVATIRYYLRRRLKFRDYEIALFNKIKEDMSARIITSCARKHRNNIRICTSNVLDSKIYINTQHSNPYVQKIHYNETTKRYEMTLFVAKTFDIENGAFISFQRLCKFMVDEIRSMLSLDPNNTLKQLNIDGLSYKQTNYQLQLGSIQKICIRGIKSMKEVQQNIILRQYISIKQQIINAKLQKKLIMSTHQLKNSTQLQIIKKLNEYIAKETYVPEEADEDISLRFVNTKFVQRCTVEDNHEQMSNTPYFISVQIDNQELISMFMYFLNTVHGQVFECDLRPKAIPELLKYGQHICEHLMPTTTKQTSQEVFSQHDLSISMYRKNIKQKLYIVTEAMLYPLQLAVKVQKIYRMRKSNKKVLATVNRMYIDGVNKAVEDITRIKNGQKIKGTSAENLTQTSIQQVFLIQRATRIIQRSIRGSNGRFRHLLFWKMRDVFKSALKNQCFYIHKNVFQKLVAGKITPNRCTSLHCNLSEPVSTSNAYRIFYNKDIQLNVQQLFQDMGYYTQHYRQLCTLILHDPKSKNANSSQDKLFSCFTSQLYSAKKAVNNGYIQLKSLFMGESPLNSRWLKTWVSDVPNMQEQKFEFLGVAIKSKLNSHTEKLDTGYDALKSMCGLQFHGQQENTKADKLLNMFEIELLKQSFDIQRLVKNIFSYGVKIKELSDNKQFLKISLNEEENCSPCDLALKSLVLEMTFCQPMLIPYNNFISRWSHFVTRGGIAMSADAYQVQRAAIVVQKHIKKTLQYQKYLQLPRQTSFIKKIMILCQQNDADLSSSKEKAAVQVIQSNYLDREVQNQLKQQRINGQLNELNDILIIKKPEFRIMDKATRLQQQKQLDAQRQRYQYCVQKSTIAEKQQKFLDNNKIKIEVVKRIVQTSNDQRDQRVNAISQLNKLKQTMKVNSVQTAGLLDDQMKNQILLTLRDGEEAGITIPEQIADLLDSVYDINEDHDDIGGQKLSQINICNNKTTNTPNYRPRIPSPDRTSQQHTRIKMMYQQEQRLKNATLRDTTRKRLNSTAELLKDAKNKRKLEYEEYYKNLKQMKEKRDEQVINDLKDRVQQQRKEQLNVASQLKSRLGLSNTLRNAMSVNQSKRTPIQ